MTADTNGNDDEQERGIPNIVIGRLPTYLRALERMQTEGVEQISSHELGQHLGISSAQIRKDLSQFGEFGRQGIGYQIKYLVERLTSILKVDRQWAVALVGLGDLGHALANYRGFANRGFHIAAIYDADPKKIGSMVNGLDVKSAQMMTDDIRARGIRLAMLAVPADVAQAVAEQLVAAGVRGILNYAPVNLSVPDEVQVQYIDPAMHLQHMTYYLETEDAPIATS